MILEKKNSNVFLNTINVYVTKEVYSTFSLNKKLLNTHTETRSFAIRLLLFQYFNANNYIVSLNKQNSKAVIPAAIFAAMY